MSIQNDNVDPDPNILIDNTAKGQVGETYENETLGPPEDGLTIKQRERKKTLEQQQTQYGKKFDQVEKEKEKREQRKMRYSAQDRDQYDQSKFVLDTRDYRKQQKIAEQSEQIFGEQMKIYNVEKEHYDKKLSEYEKEKAKYDKEIKAYENAIKLAERDNTIWHYVEPYTPLPAYVRTVTKGGSSYQTKTTAEMEKRNYEAWYKKNKSKIEANKAYEAKYGSRPSVSYGSGMLSRTAADVLFGNTAYNPKQLDSETYRQIALYKLAQEYNKGGMSFNQYLDREASIRGTVAKKSNAEQERRNWSSAISAKSAAAQASEKHQMMLKDMNKANRNAQMLAVTQMNKVVAAKAGLQQGQVNLQQAKGKLQQQTNVQMVSPNPVQQTTNKPQSANSIYDIPQASFAALMAGRSNLNETFNISREYSTQKGDRINRPITTQLQQIDQGMFQGPIKPQEDQTDKAPVQNSVIGFMGIPYPTKLDKNDPMNFQTAKQTGDTIGYDKNPFYNQILGQSDEWGKATAKTRESWEKSGNPVLQFMGGVGTEMVTTVQGIVSTPATVSDLWTTHVDKKEVEERKQVTTPKTMIGEGITGAVEGKGIDPLQSHVKSTSVPGLFGEAFGFVGPFFIPGGAGAKATQIGGRTVTAPIKATVKQTGKTFGDVLPVGKEWTIFGRPIISKTLKNLDNVSVVSKPKNVPLKTKIKETITRPEIKSKPTQVSEVKLVKPEYSWSVGRVKPKTVAQRFEVSPQSKTGYEVFTGPKYQTNFNMGLAQQTLAKNEFEKLQIVKKIIDLSQKKPKYVDKTPQPTLVTRLTPEQNMGLSNALKNLQSPKNWLKARRRTDQVGGSTSQQPQLRPEYRKVEVHDIDHDVRTEAIAVRSAKTVYDEVKPFSITAFRRKSLKGNEGLLDNLLVGDKSKPKSILSGSTDDLDIHHLEKGGKSIIVTKKEHEGLTALQGQLGPIGKVKNADEALKAFGEQTKLGDDALKNVENILSNPEKLKRVRTAIDEGYEKAQALKKKYGEIDIQLSSGRGTKVETVIKGETDEFYEALSPKDALAGNLEAQKSGLRFGKKYRVDKLSKVVKPPIKHPSGFKIRDIKDQFIAKGSSIASVQGSGSELFRGVPKAEHIGHVTKAEQAIKSGELIVTPPMKRTKDVVDLYNLSKSGAIDFKKSWNPVQKLRGPKMDKYAEQLKEKFPGIDYKANTQGSLEFTEETSSASLFKSASISHAPESISGSAQASRGAMSVGSLKGESSSSKSNRSDELNSIYSRRSVANKSSSSFGTSNVSVGSSKSISNMFSPKSATSIRSTRSVRSTRSARSARSSRSNKSGRSVGSPSIFSPSIGSPGISPGKFPGRSPGKSPGRPNIPSSGSTTSPSVSVYGGSSVSKISSGAGAIMKKPTSQSSYKAKGGIFLIKLESATDKKPGKKFKTHDFLGNTKTDHIVGLFRRTERMLGDKKTDRQVSKDKLVDPYKKTPIKKRKRKVSKSKRFDNIVMKNF